MKPTAGHGNLQVTSGDGSRKPLDEARLRSWSPKPAPSSTMSTRGGILRSADNLFDGVPEKDVAPVAGDDGAHPHRRGAELHVGPARLLLDSLRREALRFLGRA